MDHHRDDGDAPGLVGRGALWAELTGLFGASRTGAAVLLVGPAGIGKTALVEQFTAAAAKAGHPVTQTRGRPGMTATPYAALRELVTAAPVTAAIAALPERQRDALRSAQAGAVDQADLLTVRLALSAALEPLAGDQPLVLVVDDVDRLDAPSFDLLLAVTAAIAWNQLPVVALFTARDDRMPLELAGLTRVLTVPALSDREAERLLNDLGHAPTPTDRHRLLEHAAGNPLALRELSRRPDRPDTTVRAFVETIEELPGEVRRALAFAAAGESRISVIAAADPRITAEQWQSAADAGLVQVLDGWVRFRHPLIEYAALLVAGESTERQLHRLLAGVVDDRHQALWHRAKAADSDDPALAQELIDAATQPTADPTTALRLLELAVGLLPPADHAAVLLPAAGRAAAIGRTSWAATLTDAGLAAVDRTARPDLHSELVALASWTRTVKGRLDEGAELLRTMIAATDPISVPALATLVVTAGLPAFLLGSPDLDRSIVEGLRRLPPALGGVTLMPRAVADPGPDLIDAVHGAPSPATAADVIPGVTAAAAAMLMDEPEDSLRLLEPAVRMVLDGTANGVYLTAPGVAGWALIDLGRWTEAERTAVPLLSLPVAAEAPVVRVGAYTQLAVIAYGRGRPGAATELLAQGRRQLDAFAVPAFAIRLRWAEAQSAMAVGDYERAYRLLDAAATAEGVHHGWQVLVLPDLVSAAMRVDAGEQARVVVERIAARGEWLTGRRAHRLAAARSLLAGEAPTVGPGAWPHEQAVLAVEVADRLRRTHQPVPARAVLLDALDTFDRLRAAEWVARIESELRVRAPAPRADPLASVTAQQELIARLAAQGLTNRQIGERLFLSPRTIGSHLYKIFPLLGVNNRAQLSDLLVTADRHQATSE